MNEQAIVYDIRTATADDIPGLLALQAENQISRGVVYQLSFRPHGSPTLYLTCRL